ncbi:MAG: hypothetical protein KGH59_03130 [Candidatus Micrarchaeota archaeon]|nr:hypothetical protein [Candidatus Micrarchaeota archaeon]MDE1804750.1 hypothetical protein [Candidatus Micrarchaeota archaeon]MDE1847212.1 hypothetical protein [Candidatus Micrarchaeota archaeon]
MTKQKADSERPTQGVGLSTRNVLDERYNLLIQLIRSHYTGNNREKASALESMGSVVRDIEQMINGKESASHTHWMTKWYVAYHTQSTPVEAALVLRMERGEWKWLLFKSKPKPEVTDKKKEVEEWFESKGIDGVPSAMNAVVDIIKQSIRNGELELYKIKRTGTSSKVSRKLEEDVMRDKRSIGFSTRF